MCSVGLDEDMMEEENVLCAASAYDKKFYLNDKYDKLPSDVKDELKVICVLFTESAGGIIIMEFDDDGSLLIKTEADEGDLLYDEIGASLEVRRIQREYEETFKMLEMYYRVFFLGQKPEDAAAE